MIAIPAAGFAQFSLIPTAGISNQQLMTSVARAGNNISNNSLSGNMPIVDGASADQSTPNRAATDNASQTATTSVGIEQQSLFALASTSSGMSGEGGCGDDGQNFPAHMGAQWMGKSLRAPMASGGKPNGNSQNIFFKFHGPSGQDVPAIWMWINPNQLVINHSKKIQEQVTRGGFVIFHWGDNLDEINASGVTGSFARLDLPGSKNGVGDYKAAQPDVGIDRRNTWPYLRFIQLLALYRNNGVSNVSGKQAATGGFAPSAPAIASIFSTQQTGAAQDRNGTSNNTGNSVTNGQAAGDKNARLNFAGIEIHYDDNVFIGYFTSFTWTERAEDPFKFTFDFKFTVLNTTYNKVYQTASQPIKPKDTSSGLLGNFQIPRFNSL